MTETEQKALALVREVLTERNLSEKRAVRREVSPYTEALCRAIEQHEAFRQEVSDAVEQYWASLSGAFVAKPPPYMARFIIAKPDPLVEAVGECDDGTWETKAEYAQRLRAAIEKRGGKIVWGEG